MSTLALNKHTPVDATAGPVSMLLPGGAASGSEVSVEKYDSSSNAVTVTGSIRGVSAQTITLSLYRETVAFRADSSGSWWPIGGHKTLTSLDARFASQIIAPAATGSDQLSALQSGLNAAASSSTPYVLNGAHKINGTLSVPSGAVIDGTRGSLTQMAALTPALTIAGSSKVRLRGIPMSGPMSDYVNNSTVYGACGVQLSSGASDVVIEDCTLNFAGGGIYILDNTVSDVHFRRNKIKGPGATYITSTSFNFSFGIGTNGGTVNWSVIGCDISGFSQGIVTGDRQQDVRFLDNYIHDIPGQHGIYCESTDGLVISRNIIRNTGLLGMKVQIGAATYTDGTGTHPIVPADTVIVSHNEIINAGAQAILITPGGSGNTAPAQRVLISHNIIRGTVAGHGIEVAQTSGVTVEGNIIYSPSNSGIAVNTGCTGVTVAGNRINLPGQSGIIIQDSVDWLVERNRIIGSGQAGVASAKNGITIVQTTSCTDGTVRDNKITDVTSKMQYGIGMASGDQANIDFVGNYVTGATDYGGRFLAGITPRAYRNNSLAGGIAATLNGPASSPQPIGSTADWGYLGQAYINELATANQTAFTAQTLYTVRVRIPEGGSVSKVSVIIGNAGASLANCYVGVYADGTGGALLAQSADISGSVSAGEKTFNLSSSTTVAAGAYVYLAFLVGAGTGLQVRGVSGSASGNLNGKVKYGQFAGSYTTLPSALPTITGATIQPFLACQ